MFNQYLSSVIDMFVIRSWIEINWSSPKIIIQSCYQHSWLIFSRIRGMCNAESRESTCDV